MQNIHNSNLKTIIAVVEDDKLLNDLLVKKFHNEGFEVVGFLTGPEFLQYLEGNKPAVVLLDLMLPDMDGFEILQKIRANETTKTLPVIILSNLDEERHVERAKAIGIDDYLMKGVIDLHEVVTRVRVLLNSKKT